jgi:hypothetical protein
MELTKTDTAYVVCDEWSGLQKWVRQGGERVHVCSDECEIRDRIDLYALAITRQYQCCDKHTIANEMVPTCISYARSRVTRMISEWCNATFRLMKSTQSRRLVSSKQ